MSVPKVVIEVGYVSDPDLLGNTHTVVADAGEGEFGHLWDVRADDAPDDIKVSCRMYEQAMVGFHAPEVGR